MTEFVLDNPAPSLGSVEIRTHPNKDEISGYQGELDAYHIVLKNLTEMEPAAVLQAISSFSARASEMRSVVMRQDSRRGTSFRTRELDPFIDELDRQFKIHSRLISLREFDWKLAGGQQI